MTRTFRYIFALFLLICFSLIGGCSTQVITKSEGIIHSTYKFPLGGNAIVVGKVIDIKSMEALIGVNIKIYDTSNTYRCATDLDGNYHMFNIWNGTYTIEARYIGYKSAFLTNIKLGCDQLTVINFELADSAIAGLRIWQGY